MLSRSSNSLEALEGTVPLEVANETAVDHQATTPSHGRRTETMRSSLSIAAAECVNEDETLWDEKFSVVPPELDS